jgi:YgiT-type zinc finger domain-containing protein
MTTEPVAIRCSVCNEGRLVHRIIDHDVGDLLGLTQVKVNNLPALVCSHCGAVSMYGWALDEISFHIAGSVLSSPELGGIEVRFLRKLLGDTQDELAQNLGVSRATVNRWENGVDGIKGTDAYSVRAHAFFRLRGHHPAIEETAAAFIENKSRARSKTGRYQIEGASLQRAV